MINHKYKYICLDFDGTLLDSNKSISLFNQKVIVDVHQKGIGFIVATGRHLKETIQLLEKFNIIHCFDYAIFADGCGLFDFKKDTMLNHTLLTKKDVKTIIRTIGQKSFEFYNEVNDYFVSSDFLMVNLRHVLQLFKSRNSKKKYLYFPFMGLFYGNIEKQKMVFPYKVSPSLKDELNKNGLYVLLTSRGTEILPVNKNLALEQLLKMINVSKEEVLYFGDDFNDKECFECFDSIVMGNAPNELQKYSMIPVETNDEDGVGHALDEFFGGISC